MTFRKAAAALLALLLAVPPAAAQRIAAPVLAPVLPGASVVLPTPVLAPSLTAAVGPALEAPGLAAPSLLVPKTVAAAAAPATAAHAEAIPAQTALAALGDTLSRGRESGRSAAPALAQAFDASARRSGVAVAAVVETASPGAAASGGLFRSLASLKELRFGSYNVLNLFEKVGKHVPDPEHPGAMKQVSGRTPKEEWQRREQARAIIESGLDVVALQEVENIAALDDFNEHFLGGAYKTLLIEGNDPRGIDVAFLVKKDLPLVLEQRSHKDEEWEDPAQGGARSKLFSRDLASLIVRTEASAAPLFVFLGTHMKSKRDRPGDPESVVQRRAQAERTAEIVERYRNEFGADARILLAGDFNGDLNSEDTYAPLWKAGLTNSLALGGHPVPLEERVTHTYHPREGARHAAQMDGILVSESLKGLVGGAEVYRYKDDDGKPKPIPQTYEERGRNPSDHFPLVMTLRVAPLLRPAAAPPAPSAPAQPGERRLAALGLTWSFLAIASMYIVLPVRSAFLLTQFGPSVMPWVFMASAAFTGLAAWVYARFAGLPRAKLIGGTLAVLAAGLAGWWALAPLAMASGPLSFAFSMWTDAFSIMSVTLFWTYANDRFKGEAAKRWFGPFAAAGALGGMAGSAATKVLVTGLGTTPLLLIGAAVFAGIGAVFALMERQTLAPAPEAAPKPAPPQKPDSSPWAVAKAVLASPFLLALTAVVFFERLVPDFSYYLFSVSAQAAYPTREAMAAFLASFGFWQSLASLVTSAALTGWVLKKLGVGKTLLGAPLANLLGFIGFALSPTLGAAVAANGVEGWQRYGWFKAAKETTYSAADKGLLYAVKAYIEMFVYRFARGVAGLILLLLTSGSFLGWGPSAVAWAAVPLGLAWVYAAWKLGSEYKKRS